MPVYIEEDEIRGALCMRYRSDGNLTTMKGYISPNIQYKYAMTMLIAVLIHNVKTVIKPGSSIYVKIYRDGFYESAKKLFGDAQEEIVFSRSTNETQPREWQAMTEIHNQIFRRSFPPVP